jgi:hypothetical protein
LPKVLGATGAEKVVGFATGAAELKMAVDIGFTLAEAIGCSIDH